MRRRGAPLSPAPARRSRQQKNGISFCLNGLPNSPLRGGFAQSLLVSVSWGTAAAFLWFHDHLPDTVNTLISDHVKSTDLRPAYLTSVTLASALWTHGWSFFFSSSFFLQQLVTNIVRNFHPALYMFVSGIALLWEIIHRFLLQLCSLLLPSATCCLWSSVCPWSSLQYGT